MQRTKTIQKADAILTGDWHLREDQPTCRTDNFWDEQWKKVDFIAGLQREHRCPVLHSGDLFHYWKASPYLLSKTMEVLPEEFYTVIGNHDMPQHNLELIKKSGINVLAKANFLIILEDTHFNQPLERDSLNIENRSVAVWHTLTYKTQEPYPGCTIPKAAKLLRKYPMYDLILTGDNHQPFVEEYDGRILVNPGCITRQTAAFIDFRPRVYLYYAKNNNVTPVYLPISKGVISREHLDKIENRNERIDAFISQLSGDWEAGLSFDENLKRFMEVNSIKESVKNIIYKAIEQ